MADKLDWLNKHMVLLRYVSLAEVIEQEGYKIRPDLEELFTGMTGAEDMVFKFAGLERYKCACELMAYIAHKRAAVWWGYRCVLSLAEELRINPAEERDIAGIGAKLEPEIPDFAKVEPLKATAEDIVEIEETLAKMQSEYEKVKAAVDPKLLKFAEDAMDIAYKEFESVHGISIKKLKGIFAEKILLDPHEVDPNSPIFVEAAKLKTEIAAMQKETVDTIKSVIPPKVPEHQKKLRDNALDAIYRWIAAPNAENSQACMQIGNECPDTPAGLLALTAFWSFGDLLPMGELVVTTPPGLAPNGLCQVLLLCALHPGGTRKLKDRYDEYFKIGVDVLTGAYGWERFVAEGKAPHIKVMPKEIFVSEETNPEDLARRNPDQTQDFTYKRWKSSPGGVPENPTGENTYKRWKPPEEK